MKLRLKAFAKKAGLEVLMGTIPGGRGGTKFIIEKITLPDVGTADAWEEYEESDESVGEGVPMLVLPNNPEVDIPAIYEALAKGEAWVGCDVFGEGTVGFAPLTYDPKQLKLKCLETSQARMATSRLY